MAEDDPSLTRRTLLYGAGAASLLVAAGCAEAVPGAQPDARGAGADGGAGSPDAQGADANSADRQADDAAAADAEAADTGLDDPESIPESTAFPLGVASGDAIGDRVVLWTRYDGAAELEVVVWRMNGSRLGPVHARSSATTGTGAFVHVEIDRLAAGVRYRYVFFEREAGVVRRSALGRFRAPIADDSLESVVFGATSCTDNSKPFDTLDRAAEADLDAFIFAGDTAYCEDCNSIDDYRRYWVLHTEKEAHRRLRASTSILATWDDHEVANDWDPERIDPSRLQAARQAFFENLPLARLAEDPDRIWRSARWGRTVEVFVLDCRSERRPSTRRDPEATYISAAQLDWLKRGLRESPATFKLIVNSVPITNMPPIWDLYTRDRWEGYTAQRQDLLEFIEREAIAGVLWIAGDFHLSFISTIASSGPGQSLYEVLVGPGAQTSSPLVGSLNAPQFEWASGENNYTQLRFDPTARTIAVLHIGADGSAIHSRSFVFPA